MRRRCLVLRMRGTPAGVFVILECRTCGNRTQAADGSCNGVLYYDKNRGWIPVYCMGREFNRVESRE